MSSPPQLLVYTHSAPAQKPPLTQNEFVGGRMLNLPGLQEPSEANEDSSDTLTSTLTTPRCEVSSSSRTPRTQQDLLSRLKEAQTELADAQGKFLSLKRKFKKSRSEGAESRAESEFLKLQNEQLAGSLDAAQHGQGASPELAEAVVAALEAATAQLSVAKTQHIRVRLHSAMCLCNGVQEISTLNVEIQRTALELEAAKLQRRVSLGKERAAVEASRVLREQLAAYSCKLSLIHISEPTRPY
eukprot:TRINITY_DN14809_c0_g1_i2.p1 TRINITY_DN14809_c0_g1~~TRINITY_DN14809_c0_g1_i2.p1  ORF type:complete len:243 (+),score=61.94 TRINITY_DN14809_c0_g1_i2:268-996(+)